MNPVGQFHHDDADVLHHGEHHFAEALRLAVLRGRKIQLTQLGEAVYTAGHFLAELFADLLDGDAGVLHDVMQQPGFHGHDVHAHVGKDVGHHDRVEHVRLAGIAGLAFVIFLGEPERLLEHRKVVFRTVLANLGFQLAVDQIYRVGGVQLWYGI